MSEGKEWWVSLSPSSTRKYAIKKLDREFRTVQAIFYNSIKVLSFTTEIGGRIHSFFHFLKTVGLQKLWILFGAGKGQKYMYIKAVFVSIGEHWKDSMPTLDQMDVTICNERKTELGKCEKEFLKQLKSSNRPFY